MALAYNALRPLGDPEFVGAPHFTRLLGHVAKRGKRNSVKNHDETASVPAFALRTIFRSDRQVTKLELN